MPMRFGEMVLIIRTQDFASRNLERVSANLGKLSKFQQLQRRQMQQQLRESRVLSRMDTARQDIKNLQQRLALESRLASVAQDRALLQKRLKTAQTAAAKTGQIRGPTGFIGSAAPTIAAVQQNLSALQRVEADLTDQQSKLLQKINATSPALAKLSSSAAAARIKSLSREFTHLGKELQIVQGDLAITQNALNQIKWEKIHRAGQALSRTGRVMQLTGIIGAGALTMMGNAAADFSQNITAAATQARDINAPIAQVAVRSEKLQKAVLDQMQKFPASADDMAQASYKIFSSLDLADHGRIQFWKGLQILDKANKVAVAGNVDLGESIDGLVILLNNFDPSLTHVNATLDTMFDIVRFGNLTVADFTTLITRVASTAKGVGHTLEDLAAPIAFLTRVLPSERVGTGLFRLEEVFANRDFQQGFKIISKARLGKAFDFQKAGGGLKPFSTLLDHIAEVFPEIQAKTLDVGQMLKLVSAAGKSARTGKPSEGQLFTSQARNVLRPLIQNLEEVHEIQDLIIGNKGEFGRSFAALSNTDAIKWKIFLNTLKALAIEIGTAVLPALLGLAGAVRSAINWWHSLSENTRTNIVRFGLIVSVLTLLGGVLFSVVGGLVAVAAAMALLSGSMGTAGGTGVLGRTALFLTMLGRLAAIGTITITIGVIFKKVGLWQKFEDFSRDLTNKLGLTDPEVKGIFNPDAKLFPGGVNKDALRMWDDIHKARSKGDMPSFDELLKGASKQTMKDLVKLSGMSLDDLQQQFGNTGQSANEMANAVHQAAQQAEDSIDQAAANMTNIWKQFRDENVSAFGELFSGPFFQSETWSLAEEWDVKPTMREINKDLQQQIGNFRKWRGTLAAISKRKGVTPELMKELQALGPDAMDKLEILRRAAPKQFNQFITLWRTKQKEIEKATKIDFDKQLKQWFKFGSDIAKNIILGLQGEDVALDRAFKQFITNKFPNIIEDAKAEARREFRRQAGAGKPTPTKPKAPTTAPAPNQTNSNNQTTIIVHPAPGETTLHALRRGAWEFKNGGGHRGRTTPPKNAKVFVDPPGPHPTDFHNPYTGPTR